MIPAEFVRSWQVFLRFVDTLRTCTYFVQRTIAEDSRGASGLIWPILVYQV